MQAVKTSDIYPPLASLVNRSQPTKKRIQSQQYIYIYPLYDTMQNNARLHDVSKHIKTLLPSLITILYKYIYIFIIIMIYLSIYIHIHIYIHKMKNTTAKQTCHTPKNLSESKSLCDESVRLGHSQTLGQLQWWISCDLPWNFCIFLLYFCLSSLLS